MENMDVDRDILLLKSIGLSNQKINETLKNRQIMNNLQNIIDEITKFKTIELIKGNLVYHLACNIKTQIKDKILFLAQYIAEEKLDSTQRIDAALNFLLENIQYNIDSNEFEKACGIGITVTPEEIEREVEASIKQHKSEIIEKRYRFNTGILMQEIRNKLKWADGKTIKNEIDIQIFDLLGEKNESDCIIVPTRSKTKVSERKSGKLNSDSTLNADLESVSFSNLVKSKINFHKPGENYKTEGYVVTKNTHKLLKEHLLTTGGEVRTRFPPEPNGILHIGHAKAININFGYAAAYKGSCYLRYDDTNPEKEEQKFVTGILDIVKWLGYKPTKITYSSDYFKVLYDYAIELIKKGLAYVCHQSIDDIKGFNPSVSPWRNRSVSENLSIFKDMKDGLLNEGEATLRMKITLEEGKQDPVAYRIKFSQHHRTADSWCIYPTYDFTHCLCDSLENITHSLCTKEFQSRRSSYYWLCNALDIYCPVQWEYGRLNVSYTVVSKRKILKLIDMKIVKDWDDPRLYTLSALRRRGFPPNAINNFCAQMGVTGAQTIVSPSVLEASVRDVLNVTAPRHMAVIDPIKLVIVNFEYNKPIVISISDFPSDKTKGSHSVILDKIVYIDSSDFREMADENFKRLTMQQAVGLKYAGIVLNVQKVIKDIYGSITTILVSQEIITEHNKPKAFIQWVSQPSLVNVRIYERLFQHKNPEDVNEVPHGFLSDLNYKSKRETFAYVDTNFENNLDPVRKYQFERIGFFSVDPDSKPGKVILNKTVSLKEASLKI